MLTSTSSSFRGVLSSWWLPGVLVTLALGPFYWLSAVTRVGGGDWGQFQTFGYMGGIAHAPGYPLIIGSINLATRVIRFGDPAHVANIVNASFATAAGIALLYASWLLTRSRLASVVATVVFATGYSIWAQATQAGHISVQTLLLFLMVLALAAYDERPNPTRLAAVAFATGLSLTNHGLSAFMAPSDGARGSHPTFSRHCIPAHMANRRGRGNHRPDSLAVCPARSTRSGARQSA